MFQQYEIPDAVKQYLLTSSKGTGRLLQAFDLLLNTLPQTSPGQRQNITGLISDLALAAWEQSPFDLTACRALSEVQEQAPFLPPVAAGAVQRGALPPQCRPEALEALDKVFAKGGSPEKIAALLESLQRVEPNSLFWIGFASKFAYAENRLDWFAGFLAGQKGMPPYLRLVLQGDLLLAGDRRQEAFEKYDEAAVRFESPGLMIKKAEALYGAGNRSGAVELWQKAFAARPWDFTLALRLSDVLRERDLPGDLPAGSGVVLLYSWNNAADLDITLGSLAATTPPQVPILLLDNGSTDDTAAVCKRWEAELGGRLSLVPLPINIGAPAARNWLISTPEVCGADWVVFLDDDAVVPPLWLNYFGKARQCFPKAGIFGCRVNYMAAPQIIQSADLHEERPLEPQAENMPEAAFQITDFHGQIPDRGELGYMRPCLHVTGCCHLITRENLDSVGGFNLMFSPSQFDDYERDLRSGIGGSLPVYNGHLRVMHRQRSGWAKFVSLGNAANINGNSLKVRLIYSIKQRAMLQKQDFSTLAGHLDECLEVIGGGRGDFKGKGDDRVCNSK